MLLAQITSRTSTAEKLFEGSSSTWNALRDCRCLGLIIVPVKIFIRRQSSSKTRFVPLHRHRSFGLQASGDDRAIGAIAGQPSDFWDKRFVMTSHWTESWRIQNLSRQANGSGKISVLLQRHQVRNTDKLPRIARSAEDQSEERRPLVTFSMDTEVDHASLECRGKLWQKHNALCSRCCILKDYRRFSRVLRLESKQG